MNYGLLSDATPETMRKQRELAARARGEPFDDIHEVLVRELEDEELARRVRRALKASGYEIRPR